MANFILTEPERQEICSYKIFACDLAPVQVGIVLRKFRVLPLPRLLFYRGCDGLEAYINALDRTTDPIVSPPAPKRPYATKASVVSPEIL